MMPSLVELLKTHWRKLALAAVVALAFATGRYSTPTKVQTKTVEQVVYRDRVVKEKAETQVQKRVIYRDRTVIKRPDGTVVQRDVTRTGDEKANSTVTRQAEEHVTYRDREVVKTVETAKPNLMISALGGFDFSHPGFAWGASAQYRPIDKVPLFVGAWGLSTLTFGISVGFQF